MLLQKSIQPSVERTKKSLQTVFLNPNDHLPPIIHSLNLPPSDCHSDLANKFNNTAHNMNAADNYTLLRGQTNQKVQLTASNEEIKAIIKQR
jgi:hypothetical protein